jgi:beta-lactamase class A
VPKTNESQAALEGIAAMPQISDRGKQVLDRLRPKKMLAKMLTIIIIIHLGLISDAILLVSPLSDRPLPQAAFVTIETNEARQWIMDKQIVRTTVPFSPVNTKRIPIASFFMYYYQHHGAANCLGRAITSVFPTSQGWLQFFQFSALLLPTTRPTLLPATRDITFALINNGSRDTKTNVINLPLIQALLIAGAQIPIGGLRSNLTYVDLRKATAPELMRLAPATKSTNASDQNIFIQGGTRGGMAVGHFIISAFWHYMQHKNNAPDGWQVDFGTPLTEALSFTARQKKVIHHMQIQVFAHTALLLDQDRSTHAHQPIIERLTTGLDYLWIMGSPTAAPSIQSIIWTPTSAVLFSHPDAHRALAHIGRNFALTLLGATLWTKGRLWYHVQWSIPRGRRSGWVLADAMSIYPSNSQAAWSSFDLLSPKLAHYLAQQGANVSTLLYDVTRQRYYNYQSTNLLIAASSIKVPIMLTFLDMIERQRRTITSNELMLLTTMIENSNNTSASILYYNKIGSAKGISTFMTRIGIDGIQPDAAAWGYSLINPQAMVSLLTKLHAGAILNAGHRQLALYLMQHIEADQRIGVGDTAPRSASVAMKNGWVVGPNNLWVMNTSGIVTLKKETYILSVYTQNQATLMAGQAIVSKVCASIVPLIT